MGASKRVFDLTVNDRKCVYGGTTESGTGVRAVDGGTGKDAAGRPMVSEVMRGTGGK